MSASKKLKFWQPQDFYEALQDKRGATTRDLLTTFASSNYTVDRYLR